MCGTEVLQHRQAFAEVRLNRRLDNLTGWLGHQTTHTSQLSNLFDTTTSTRVRHQEHWIDVPIISNVSLHGLHHVGRDRLASFGPLIKHHVVAFVAGHQTAVVRLLVFHDRFLGLLDEILLGVRSHQVIGRERQTTSSRFSETHLHHVIKQMNRGFATKTLVAIANHASQVTTTHCVVVIIHSVRKHAVEQHTPWRSLDDRTVFYVLVFGFQLLEFRQSHLDPRMQLNDALGQRHFDFVVTGKHHSFALLVGQVQRGVIATHHDVLRRTHNRFTVGRREHVVGTHHQRVGFHLCFD